MIKAQRFKGKINSIFWLKYSVFIFIVIALTAYVLRVNDPALATLEPYLLNNEEIKSRVGIVKNYYITKTIYVSASEEMGKYNEYKIRIVGKDKIITIKVRAKFIDAKGIWSFSVVRVY